VLSEHKGTRERAGLPYEGLCKTPDGTRSVTGPSPASHGVTPLFRVLTRFALAPASVGCSPHVLGLRRTAGSSCAPDPEKLKSYSRYPLVSLRPPSESSRCRAATTAPRDRNRTSPKRLLPWGLLPLQRVPAPGSGFVGLGLPSPNRLRLQVFSTSWRLHPPERLPALFRAGSAHGVRPSKLCSSHAGERRLRRHCPPVVQATLRTNPTVHTKRKRPTRPAIREGAQSRPRLQGFAPRESPPHHAQRIRLDASA